MTRFERAAALLRGIRRTVATASLSLLVLVIVGSAWILELYDVEWIAGLFFGPLVWLLAVLCGIAHAIAGRKLVLRVLAVGVGLAAPWLAEQIMPTIGAIDAQIERSRVEAASREKEQHLAFLQEYLSEPRKVIFERYPYVVVEGGYSLLLDDIWIAQANPDSVEGSLASLLAGRKVTAAFPADFLKRYRVDVRRKVTDGFRTDRSRHYGDAPAKVSVDGVSVNSTLNARWGRRNNVLRSAIPVSTVEEN